MSKSPDYEKNVFINCPFDREYSQLFRALVFTIHSLGLRPRSAFNITQSELRIRKLFDLISECKYGIHDISRTELDKKSGFPRFNMPFELGLDIGCKEFHHTYNDKRLLIFDREAYRFQTFFSDIAGYDPKPHSRRAEEVIQITTDWIRADKQDITLPNGKQIYNDYKNFEIDFKVAKKTLPKKLSFIDYSFSIAEWFKRVQ
jgi:hypothetical protein